MVDKQVMVYFKKHSPKKYPYICMVVVLLLSMYVLSPHMALSATASSTPLPDNTWGFEGLFGEYDKTNLQRGFQVYQEACASCHGLKWISYRNLQGIGYSPEDIKNFAAQYSVLDGPNEEGEMYERPALASDRFISPFANDEEARASNNGAFPVDLSLLVKARPNGADYLYALLTGYHEEPPKDFTLDEAMYYNDWFPGHQIAMPPPLSDEQVEFADGSDNSIEHLARYLVEFLNWTADPKLEYRKDLGRTVLGFLFVGFILSILIKKRIWQRLKD